MWMYRRHWAHVFLQITKQLGESWMPVLRDDTSYVRDEFSLNLVMKRGFNLVYNMELF